MKVKVNEESPVLLLDKYENDYTVAEGIILPNETKEYSIRIWIKDTAGNEVLGRHYHGKIVVDSVNFRTTFYKDFKKLYDDGLIDWKRKFIF